MPAPISQQVETSKRSTLAGALLCAAATVACLAPFANKAFHIDDPLFLYAARQISAHPADPFGFQVTWYEDKSMPMADVTQNGPLTSYYIALAARLVGWSEIALHLAFLIPAAAAIVGTYFLAVDLCTRPLLAALATLLCPVFMVSSTSVMSDTLMLALWVWAVVLWRWNVIEGSHVYAALSALLIAAAGVTKYYAIALIPLLAAYSLLCWPRVRWRILYLAIPVAALAAYDGKMHALYGHSMLLGAASFLSTIPSEGNVLLRGLIALCFAGGCILTALFYAPLLWSRRAVVAGLLGAGLTVWLCWSMQWLGYYSQPEDSTTRLFIVVQMAVFAVGGISLLALPVADLWRSRNAESCLLLLWLVGTFVFTWSVNWTINGRSIFPMAPAASILIVRRLDRRGSKPQGRFIPWEYVPLALTGLVAAMVVWADAALANTGRMAAAEFHRRYGDQGHTVWFVDHFGYQYYMESHGARIVTANSTIMPADVLIVLANDPLASTRYPRVFSERLQLQWPACSFLTTMDPRAGAGFYSSLSGPLPFAFGMLPPQCYQVLGLTAVTKPEERIARYEREVALHPDSAELLEKLAGELIGVGRTAEAKGHLQRAVQLKPNDAGACNNLAWLLATQEPAQGGDPAEALSLAQRACKLTGGQSCGCLDTLAAAYAASGRFPEAVAAAEKAAELASAAGQTALAKRIEGRLELYRHSHAYQESLRRPITPGP